MKLPVDTAQITSFAENSWQVMMDYAPKVISALVVLVIGLIIIRMIVNGVRKAFEKKKFDVTLQRFLVSMISILLKAALAITVIGMLGIQMTTFVAMLGAAGLAIGLALSGTLQNFAGGVILLILRPYRVGDFVEMQGHSGTVKEIQIFNTIMTTPDNKTIIIPNSPISTGSMINYSTQPKRRVDFTIGIGYDDDIDKAREVILGVITKDERVHKDPEPFIAVSALADSSVNFVLRVWADSGDYWGVYFENLEAIKKALDANNISIPYPQRDVHLHTVEK
ncbi:mechanosensitive ion channel protein MscS [Kangiella profundi]|uniref:Small-conductance mechanosensitive channel n=1 Tax=Kangiella profundi TaxID=1561924 RepID=A0A2K9AAH3_9GAMM|nr:mechanosensitive ion channel domain-containing protein [Kangiella profundi]AUD78427.1 mechanosensitive ion channel protein MscS [Kangiella profundi]GGF07848.1 mechanosensitive ion channel protein [Kangiella profundi]